MTLVVTPVISSGATIQGPHYLLVSFIKYISMLVFVSKCYH